MSDGVTYKPVAGFPNYRVGDDGSVESRKRLGWKRLKPSLNHKGYERVTIGGRMVSVHKIVLMAFRGECPDGMETCHENGNPSDNRLINLRWDTKKANCRDRALHCKTATGERNGQAKLNENSVAEIRAALVRGEFHRDIAKRYGVHKGTISKINLGVCWSIQ